MWIAQIIFYKNELYTIKSQTPKGQSGGSALYILICILLYAGGLRSCRRSSIVRWWEKTGRFLAEIWQNVKKLPRKPANVVQHDT